MARDNDKLIELGNRIKEARKLKKISQIELADAANISVSHLSNIENGKKSISIDLFIRVVEALQVSADWLLRTDTPEVKKIVSAEFDELLKDKSKDDIERIVRLVKEFF